MLTCNSNTLIPHYPEIVGLLEKPVPRLRRIAETGGRLTICDSLSLDTAVLSNDIEASFLESQNRKPDPGFGLFLNTPCSESYEGCFH